MNHDERRRSLLAQVEHLRIPRIDELNKPLGAVKIDSLRVATDGRLAERLVQAGLATRFQRRTHLPRKDGRKLPTILELQPDGPPTKRAKRGRPPAAKPSVEELRDLVARIATVENELLAEKTRNIGERIAETKRRLLELSGDAEANAIRELSELTAARRSIAKTIRDEVFRRIERDEEFPARRWLGIISTERVE